MTDWIQTDRPCPPPGADLPMQQHPTYGAACAALGSDVTWFEWREAGRLMGTAQVLGRRWPLFGRFALLSRGPALAPGVAAGAAQAALGRLVRHLRACHRGVLVTPERLAGLDPMSGTGALRMIAAGHVARLSLDADPVRLRAGLHQKWRNRLTQSERSGLEVAAGTMPCRADHWLLRAEAEQARTRRYARLPPEFALEWAWAGETLLMTAMAGGRPVAGMLFLIHEPWASYHLGWTSAEGRRANAHTLLMWQAMLALKARGIRALELGVLDTVGTPDLARFKLGTGARPVALGATWIEAPGSRAVAWMARLGVGAPLPGRQAG